MLKAVLFDFDGTIVDSLKHHLHAWKKAFLDNGSDFSDKEVIENIFYPTTVINPDPKYKITDLHLEHYFKHIDEAYKNLETHEHVGELLEVLKDSDIKMAIISFMEVKRVNNGLKAVGLSEYFQTIVGWEDVEMKKPNPQIAYIAMERLGVKSSETLIVGDTNWDILTGKNAGTMTALYVPEVNLPFINIEEYRATKPDFEFDDFKKFGEFISSRANLL